MIGKRYIVVWVIGLLCIWYGQDISTMFGIVLLFMSHEVGHYLVAKFLRKEPEFFIRGSIIGVRYKAPRCISITSAGMLANFALLPVLILLMTVENWMVLACIVAGAAGDIKNIVEWWRKG